MAFAAGPIRLPLPAHQHHFALRQFSCEITSKRNENSMNWLIKYLWHSNIYSSAAIYKCFYSLAPASELAAAVSEPVGE